MEFWPPDSLVLMGGHPPRTVRVNTDGEPEDGLHVYRADQDEVEASIRVLVPVGDHAIIQASSIVMDGMSGHTNDWVGVIDREGNVLHELGSTSRPFEINLKVHEYDELERFWAWQRCRNHRC